MSGKERLVAALLLAIAVAGGALIPRLLASPPTSLGIALGPGPSRTVVQAPAIPRERHRTVSPPSRVAAAPIAAPALPRTGGLPVDATAIPVLLGASAGLRSLVRRRRRNA